MVSFSEMSFDVPVPAEIKNVYFLAIKLHIYDYEDYVLCRAKARNRINLPELSEDDFEALMACIFYGTYVDWLYYQEWTACEEPFPEDTREKQIESSLTDRYLDPYFDDLEEDTAEYLGVIRD